MFPIKGLAIPRVHSFSGYSLLCDTILQISRTVCSNQFLVFVYNEETVSIFLVANIMCLTCLECVEVRKIKIKLFQIMRYYIAEK